MTVGSSVTGNLDYGSEDWYSFRPNQTGFLVIETTGVTDTYLEIYDAQDNLMMEDDDGGEEVNARVDIYVRIGATYFIKVKAFSNDITGQYVIQTRHIPTPSFMELSAGQSHSGRISAGEDYWFSFKSGQNGIMSIETFGNTDSYLDVYNASYAHAARDDDSGEGRNAKIEMFVNANQTYFVKLRAYSRNASGSYRILASFYQYVAEEHGGAPPFDGYIPPAQPLPPETALASDRANAVLIKPEEDASVTFYGRRNEGRWYSFSIESGQTNMVIYTSGVLNTYLYLYDNLGNQLARDNDSGEDRNALISKTLAAGTYFIEVMEFLNRPGSCYLHIESRAIPFIPSGEDKKINENQKKDSGADFGDSAETSTEEKSEIQEGVLGH